MALAAHQHGHEPDQADWLTADQASELTAESVRTWRWRAKLESDAARRQGRQPLAVKASPPSGKPRWLLHRSIDHRLSSTPTVSERNDRARAALLTRFPEHAVDLAYRKAYWLREWSRAGGGRRDADRIIDEAKRVEGEEFAISVRSLQLWRKAYYTHSQDGQVRGVEGLIDGRTFIAAPGDNEASAPKGRSQAAIDFFYRVYHSQGNQSAKTCHDATVSMARKSGLRWPTSYAATTRWLREYTDLAADCLHRDGRSAYSHTFMQHLEIDHTALAVAERYVLDHSQADYWCRAGSKLVRPWVTGIIDARSRCLVGWHMTVAPHQDGIVAALRTALRDWAVPEKVHIDQGKDFTSQLLGGVTKAERRRLRSELGPEWRDKVRHQSDVKWLGILGELGIGIAEATPYHPWAKALIERVFRRMHDEFDKTWPVYTGRNSDTRPECSEEMRMSDDVPTLEHCRERFGEWVELYNHSAHRGLDGATPISVWRTAENLRKAVDEQLIPLLQSRGVYRVGAQGVAFRIGGKRISYGANSVRLRRYAGRDVFVTLDPTDCSACVAYTAERDARRFIDRLDCNRPVPANTSVEELRNAIVSVRRRNKHFDRAQREAPGRMRDAAREVAALRREQREQALRATGTDDARPINVRPVRTGFVATPGPSAAAVDRKARDVSAAAKALAFGYDTTAPVEPRRPRVTLDMIAPVKDDGTEDGTDAGEPRPDLLGLVAGDQHERTERSE